jgi:hypothetical protein
LQAKQRYLQLNKNITIVCQIISPQITQKEKQIPLAKTFAHNCEKQYCSESGQFLPVGWEEYD